MNRFLAILVLGTLRVVTAHAAEDGPPSDASLHQLLDTINASKLIDSMYTNLDNAMKMGVQQASAGRPLNDAQKAIVDDMTKRVAAVFRESMSWEKLEPVLMRTYQKSLTQSEVDGMLAFYASPAGRALLQKMPLIMQTSMQEMAGTMQDLTPRIQAIMRESAEKLKAAADPVAKP